jgi:hypothetical protein
VFEQVAFEWKGEDISISVFDYILEGFSKMNFHVVKELFPDYHSNDSDHDREFLIVLKPTCEGGLGLRHFSQFSMESLHSISGIDDPRTSL